MPDALDPLDLVYEQIPPMDHTPGGKASAFTWEMGEFILTRIEAGETIRRITEDPRMPAYCTVFQWVKVNPEFGHRYRALRARQSEAYVRRVAERAAAKAFWPAHKAKVDGRRWWRRGRPCSYSDAVGKAICARLRQGQTMMAINADPAMPSAKVVYGWMRTQAEFRARSSRRGAGVSTGWPSTPTMSPIWRWRASPWGPSGRRWRGSKLGSDG